MTGVRIPPLLLRLELKDLEPALKLDMERGMVVVAPVSKQVIWETEQAQHLSRRVPRLGTVSPHSRQDIWFKML